MRRFVVVFNVTQAELDAKTFYRPKLNIVSTLRRARCVLLVVRETKQVMCVSEFTFQTDSTYGSRRIDFDAPRDVTAYVLPFAELVNAMVVNALDKSVLCYGRQLEMDADQIKRLHTQLEIIV
ncbi:hypothetical protein D5P86_00135 [Salmonella enterica subsp. enterica serovar Infantis]|nr:hypothetical protein [Salmonella enterica subsp. enterica serovar Infantis]